MLLTGIVSGSASFVWSKDISRKLLDYILVSTVATFTVPLFLTLLASSLSSDKSTGNQTLSFAGVCLIVGYNAPRFLDRMYEKILGELGATKEIAKQASLESKIAEAGANEALKIAVSGLSEEDDIVEDEENHGDEKQS